MDDIYNISHNRGIMQEKINVYFDDKISSSSYLEERNNEKLELRKKKIYNTLFSKRKEVIKISSFNDINIFLLL